MATGFTGRFKGKIAAQTIVLGGFLYESFTDSIVAHSGGGQTSAVPLTAEVNRIITVAAAGDSVRLPLAVQGLTILIINHGALAAGVFGAGTDTIDDVATATGVVQMAGSSVLYTCTTTGAWFTNGIGTGYSGSFPTQSYSDALTAHAGGGQASALQLTTVLNRITIVGSAGDSVKLPVSSPGMSIVVINAAAANSMNVYAQTGDTIDAIAANSPRAVVANKSATFYCTVAGAWHSLLTA